LQCCAGLGFVGGEIEQELRALRVTGYRYAVGGGDGGEQRVRGTEMIVAKESYGGAGLDEE